MVDFNLLAGRFGGRGLSAAAAGHYLFRGVRVYHHAVLARDQESLAARASYTKMQQHCGAIAHRCVDTRYRLCAPQYQANATAARAGGTFDATNLHTTLVLGPEPA
jgi:hypothetical protein